MPVMHFHVRWPDQSETRCYSPSLVLQDSLTPGQAYPLPDFLGRTREALPVPARCPTMPCFGGEDLRTLFVTTARKGRPADELARLPASGQVLQARTAVAGRPVDFFDD